MTAEAPRLYVVGPAGAAESRDSATLLEGFADLAPDLAELGERRTSASDGALAEGPPAPRLGIVAEGLLAVTHQETGLCVALAGPGVPVGPGVSTGEWLRAGSVLDIPLARLFERYDPSTALAVVERAAVLSRQAVEDELVCHVRHPASRRLGRWLVRILQHSDHLPITQVDLGRLAGLQRTSVCAAMASLQDLGAVKVTRGRIILRDRATLSALACQCGRPGDHQSGDGSGAMHRHAAG